ncbi:adhesion G protein-coupled receptor F5-like isoform X2 [Pleurodeles waltl]|uniref:adhesion G protein-coupled receptor F5-like isoform X2 n=1 Tax=Pleurodeles waltl TaxID=8319 RepID=UPI00370971CB
MKSCWIVMLCPLCIFFNVPSANAQEWSVNTQSSADIHSEVIQSFSKSRWKREANIITTGTESSSTASSKAVPQDYVVDIEISFPNASFLEPLKMFLKELNYINAFLNSNVITITSITVTTECSLNVTTDRCSCEAGYYWPSDTCVARPNCSSTPNGCDCINSYPPEGAYCQPVPATTPITTMKNATPGTTVANTTPMTTVAIPIIMVTTTTPITTVSTRPATNVTTTKPTTVTTTTPVTVTRTTPATTIPTTKPTTVVFMTTPVTTVTTTTPATVTATTPLTISTTITSTAPVTVTTITPVTSISTVKPTTTVPKGRSFIVAFTENYGTPVTLALELSSYDEPCMVQVTVPSPPFNETVYLAKNSTTEVVLSTEYMLTAGEKSRKLVMVNSDVEISVIAFNNAAYTADAFTCLSKQDLGTEYFILTPGNGSGQGNHFAVANGQDVETEVNITVSGSLLVDGIRYQDKQMVTITLAPQEVILLSDSNDLSGTRVVSSTPVAVFSGNKCYASPVSACDYVIEQLFPVKSWGQQFAVLPLMTKNKQDSIIIIAARPNTTVDLRTEETTLQYLLQPGSQVRVDLQNGMLVNATGPIMVGYLFQGGDSPLGFTVDPFITTVPPNNFSRSYYKFVTQDFYYNYLFIVSRSSSSSSDFLLDHRPLSDYVLNVKHMEGFTGWEVKLEKMSGQHEISHQSETFGIYVYGVENLISYGYSLGQADSFSAVLQDYVVDIEISFPNASFLEPLKMFLKELNYINAFLNSNAITITSITVTTACSLNATTVHCSCEDGYYWPSDTCVARPNCSSSPNGCDCIDSYPPEGAYCQPVPATTPITTMKNTTPVTTVANTTPITTVTRTPPEATVTTTKPTTVTTTTPVTTVTTTTPVTTVTSATPFTIPTMKPTTTSRTPVTVTLVTSITTAKPTTTVPKAHIQFQLTILETFTADLNDKTSVKYINYKIMLETEFYNSYRNSLKGFVSANVTGFREGSINVDYIIISDPPTESSLDDANENILKNLSKVFPLPPSPFVRFIYGQTNFTTSPDILFQGDTLTLTCRTKSISTSVSWTHNGVPVKISANNTIKDGVSESVLVIPSITASRAGEYSCSLNDTTVIYVASRTVSVSSINTAFDSTKDILCDGNPVRVYQWCTNGNISLLTCGCIPSGGLNIPGTITIDSNCQKFELSANSSLCPADMSGKYQCLCVREVRVLISSTISVTFTRKATVTITGTTTVSESDILNLACSTNVATYESMTWQVVRNAGGSPDLKSYYQNNNATLYMPTVLQYWAGRYTCTVSQGITNSSSSATITILPLPSESQLTTNIVDGIYTCPSTVTLRCCTTDSNKYRFQFKVQGSSTPINEFSEELECYQTTYSYTSCEKDNTEIDCIVTNSLKSIAKSIILRPLKGKPTCSGVGVGQEGDTITVPCKGDLDGTIIFTCSSGEWSNPMSYCIPKRINQLVTESQELQSKPPSEIPVYLENLSSNITAAETPIATFAAVQAVVGILETLSKVTPSVDYTMMQNFLNTADVIVKNQDIWTSVNEARRIEGGSRLLESTETFSKGLQINKSITRKTETIILKGIVVTNKTDSYKEGFAFGTTTGQVAIPNETLASIRSSSLITIAYSSLSNILTGNLNQSVNGLVMSTVVRDQNGTNSREDFKISMTFKKINSSLSNASCVFWMFNANGSGEWDTSGCRAAEEEDQVLCTCDHLTAFSILMSSSPSGGNITEEEKQKRATLEYITYIGVGISIGSLFLCLIIEALVWKSVTKNKTSYMRHVCFVNIAVSLLIADIWFIIGASLTPQVSSHTYTNATSSTTQACDAATFFIHFFYLALFFWMLTMGLILFYSLVFVFNDMSKTTMLARALSLGYGCPLLITVVTVAATRPQNYYREGNSCWLNIMNTRAFLAFVIPALTIVAVNFIILAVVIIILLRPSVGDKPKKEERSMLVKIAKSVAILTPLLGLTWGFGIGTLITNDYALNVIFSLLNSLQGFFILVFGSLMDGKTREALLRQFSPTRWASQLTKSTTHSTSRTPPTTSKSTPSKPKAYLFGRRGAYNLSSGLQSHTSEDSSHVYSTLQ